MSFSAINEGSQPFLTLLQCRKLIPEDSSCQPVCPPRGRFPVFGLNQRNAPPGDPGTASSQSFHHTTFSFYPTCSGAANP